MLPGLKASRALLEQHVRTQPIFVVKLFRFNVLGKEEEEHW